MSDRPSTSGFTADGLGGVLRQQRTLEEQELMGEIADRNFIT